MSKEAKPIYGNLFWIRNNLYMWRDSLVPQLGINTYSFYNPNSFFFVVFSLLFGRSHHGQRDPSNPAGHCTYVLSSEDFGNTTKRPLGLLCATFFSPYVCACMCNYVRLAAGGCQTGLKDTVQYSLYLPRARITAWTEPWQGANISEMIMLYSVDNC